VNGRDEKGRWLPGHSGNPRGRPRKGRALSEHLRAVLGEEVEAPDGRRVTRARLLAEVLVSAALGGDVRAARLLLEHLEGRPGLKVFEAEAEVVRVLLPAPTKEADDAD